MVTYKSYFRDHFVLSLLTANVFLAVFTAIFVFLRIFSLHGGGYIVQYRSSLGVSAFETGGVSELVSFGVFALLIAIVNFVLSYKSYKINRYLTITVLTFGLLLLVLDIIISNSLLALR